MSNHNGGEELNQPSQDSTHHTQLQTIFKYLLIHDATASMVTEATGVPQKCITRYKRDLEKAGLLWEIVKTDCKKTGCKAWYLPTDKSRAPFPPQIKL